jgi:hypothetical protein
MGPFSGWKNKPMLEDDDDQDVLALFSAFWEARGMRRLSFVRGPGVAARSGNV